MHTTLRCSILTRRKHHLAPSVYTRPTVTVTYTAFAAATLVSNLVYMEAKKLEITYKLSPNQTIFLYMTELSNMFI